MVFSLKDSARELEKHLSSMKTGRAVSCNFYFFSDVTFWFFPQNFSVVTFFPLKNQRISAGGAKHAS